MFNVYDRNTKFSQLARAMCPLTGNNAETGLDNRITAQTAEIEFYNDLNHNNPEVSGQKKNPYPIWMDTPGNDLSKK